MSTCKVNEVPTGTIFAIRNIFDPQVKDYFIKLGKYQQNNYNAVNMNGYTLAFVDGNTEVTWVANIVPGDSFSYERAKNE
jgi:hypothetical protein